MNKGDNSSWPMLALKMLGGGIIVFFAGCLLYFWVATFWVVTSPLD